MSYIINIYVPRVTATTSIPLEDWEAIQDQVRKGIYSNMSHFIREAIKQKLEETER